MAKQSVHGIVEGASLQSNILRVLKHYPELEFTARELAEMVFGCGDAFVQKAVLNAMKSHVWMGRVERTSARHCCITAKGMAYTKL